MTATVEDFGKFCADRFEELSQRFRAHLDKVPEEYREAVVEDFLDQLVEHGWIRKELRDNIGYNKDYEGDKESFREQLERAAEEHKAVLDYLKDK